MERSNKPEFSHAGEEAVRPWIEAENLRRWQEAGGPKKWAEDHAGQWSEGRWNALVDALRAGPYWPMPEAEIRLQAASAAWKHLDERERRQGESLNNALARPARWYATGLAVIGLACGFFAGASATPVVATLLPLLFALIAGTGGVYLATADLQQASVGWKLRWLGTAFGLFGLTCLAGAGAGIVARLAVEHGSRPDDLVTIWHGTTQDELQLAALRAKLQLLGVARAEQSLILGIAAQELNNASQPIPNSKMKEYLAKDAALLRTLRDFKTQSLQKNIPVPEDVTALIEGLEEFQNRAGPWAAVGMPRDLYAISLDSLFFRLSQLALPGKAENIAWMNSIKFDRTTLDAMFQPIHADFLKRDLLDWRLGQRMSDQLDKFLPLIGKTSLKLSDKADEVMPSIDLLDLKTQQPKK